MRLSEKQLQQLQHIQVYDQQAQRLGLDTEARLLEMSRFISEKGLWDEFNAFLRDDEDREAARTSPEWRDLTREEND